MWQLIYSFILFSRTQGYLLAGKITIHFFQCLLPHNVVGRFYHTSTSDSEAEEEELADTQPVVQVVVVRLPSLTDGSD